jgi:hypothetical protein
LQGPTWEKVRARVCQTLGLSRTATEKLKRLGRQLDEAYRRTAGNLPANSAVTIDHSGRRDVLKLTLLDKLDEPVSLIDLRRAVTSRLPRVDLTFASEFRQIREGNARVSDLDLSLCAVLLAEACNMALTQQSCHEPQGNRTSCLCATYAQSEAGQQFRVSVRCYEILAVLSCFRAQSARSGWFLFAFRAFCEIGWDRAVVQSQS